MNVTTYETEIRLVQPPLKLFQNYLGDTERGGAKNIHELQWASEIILK